MKLDISGKSIFVPFLFCLMASSAHFSCGQTKGQSSAEFEKTVLGAGGCVDFIFGKDRDFAQCHASTVVQCADGTVIAAWFGGTEEKNVATDLPNNNSGLDALGLKNGRVLLVYNPVGMDWGPRTPLDLALSDDNGNTWKTIAHLEDDPNQESEYSYPAIVKTKDGIAVSYTWNRSTIRCWQIPESILTADGK